MVRRDQEGVRCHAGGIISLTEFVDENSEAITTDLLRLTGHGIEELGGAISWHSLKAYLEHLPYDSALMRSLNAEQAEWATRVKTNAILADIFDMLAIINANLCGIGSGKKPKQPKPYPRPGTKEEQQTIGKGAVTKQELEEFFERKRKKWQETHQKLQELL